MGHLSSLSWFSHLQYEKYLHQRIVVWIKSRWWEHAWNFKGGKEEREKVRQEVKSLRDGEGENKDKSKRGSEGIEQTMMLSQRGPTYLYADSTIFLPRIRNIERDKSPNNTF